MNPDESWTKFSRISVQSSPWCRESISRKPPWLQEQPQFLERQVVVLRLSLEPVTPQVFFRVPLEKLLLGRVDHGRTFNGSRNGQVQPFLTLSSTPLRENNHLPYLGSVVVS